MTDHGVHGVRTWLMAGGGRFSERALGALRLI
jgi:hypothetical protein